MKKSLEEIRILALKREPEADSFELAILMLTDLPGYPVSQEDYDLMVRKVVEELKEVSYGVPPRIRETIGAVEQAHRRRVNRSQLDSKILTLRRAFHDFPIQSLQSPTGKFERKG